MQLAIITTHPIQYYAPVFKLLHSRRKINVKVFYTLGQANADQYDPGFGKKIAWDIPLLEGYDFEWIDNTSAAPGSHHFKGIVNPQLINRISAYKPDAVLIIGWAYNSHLKAMRFFKNKVPVFFRGDSTLLDQSNLLKSILRTIVLKWVYRHVDHAFYNGVQNKAYFIKYGLKQNQLSFAPHAVDNDRFAIDRKEEAQQLKQSLGIVADDLLVLFAGKLEDKKDPELLLDAVVQLNNSKVHLLFAGNGELENQLKLKAQAYPNIHFIGFKNQSNMPVVYQACDLFCLPSKGPGETWGLAVNEAMACSKAVLVSDKCGCAYDLVHDNQNGAIFKSANLNNLLAHLTWLTQNKPALNTYGRESAKIISDWNFLTIAKAIENQLIHEA